MSVWLIMWLYTQTYRYTKASVLAPISYSGVVFAGYWDWLFWGQQPGLLTLTGTALVIIGGSVSMAQGKRDS